jgi:hypothetical protein
VHTAHGAVTLAFEDSAEAQLWFAALKDVVTTLKQVRRVAMRPLGDQMSAQSATPCGFSQMVFKPTIMHAVWQQCMSARFCQAREASRHPQRSNGTATSSIGGASYGPDSAAGSLYGGSQHGSRHGSPVSTPRLGPDASGGSGTGSLHVNSFVVGMVLTTSCSILHMTTHGRPLGGSDALRFIVVVRMWQQRHWQIFVYRGAQPERTGAHG